MDTEKIKSSLEVEKAKLEKELEGFAVKDPNIKGNWDAKPINREDSDMEEKADEATEYDNLLSLEHSLELRLKDVNAALEKISAGSYGICERCGKKIEEQRLAVAPEARLCLTCNQNG